MRRKLDNAQREVHARSPTKKKATAPHKAKAAAPLAAMLDEDVFAVENAASLLRGMSLQDSPVAKIKPQTPSTAKKLR